jgi:putative endonuclease
MHKRQKGDKFESLAWSWLESHGYSLIDKNFARRIGEIDLIVTDPDNLTIVFVEVRFRSTEQFGGAIESVDHRKQRKLVRTANSWLQRYATPSTPARIDIIALRPAPQNAPTENCRQGFEITWIRNAVEE